MDNILRPSPTDIGMAEAFCSHKRTVYAVGNTYCRECGRYLHAGKAAE